jgi:hypothetical protein
MQGRRGIFGLFYPLFVDTTRTARVSDRRRAAKKERPPGGGLSGIRPKRCAFSTASRPALMVVERRYFFFAVFFAFFAFLAFLAMLPSVIPNVGSMHVDNRRA